jgi:hypothetical protein
MLPQWHLKSTSRFIKWNKALDTALNRTGFAGGSNSWEGGAIMSKTTNKFSPEVRQRAVRLLLLARA